jgi:hypothetical protein
VGYDATPAARAALAFAIRRARPYGSVIAVHAVAPAPGYLGSPSYDRAVERAQLDGRTVLAPMAASGVETALLEGRPAERRLQRAKALADRNSGFVAMVDRELLQSMTPEQLDVLAERARVRQHAAEAAPRLPDEEKGRRQFLLRVRVAGSTTQGRRVAEPLLASLTKQWQFARTEPHAGGEETIEYHVRLKKKTDTAEFIGRFRAQAGPLVRRVDLSPLDAD